MQDADLITGLNGDLTREYYSVVHYLHALYCSHGRESAACLDTLRTWIAAETSHADQIARLIVALGGRPSLRQARITGGDPAESLARALAIEQEAVVAYEERCAQTADDAALRATLARILDDERHHVAALQDMLLERGGTPAPATTSERTALTVVA